MYNFLFVAFFLVCVDGAVISSILTMNGRLTGGTPATIEEAPYIVSLKCDIYGNGSDLVFCGGSIINRNVIVTAAHCIESIEISQCSIRAGSTYRNKGGQVITVDFAIHGDDDIALLKLSENLKYGPTVAPINLPSQGMVVPDNTNALVTGWGSINVNDTDPESLYMLVVPTMNHQKCVKAYGNLREIKDNVLCTGGIVDHKEVGTCHGDSGGPLVIDNILHGVTARGILCGRKGHPSVFIRVASFRDWIDQTIDYFKY